MTKREQKKAIHAAARRFERTLMLGALAANPHPMVVNADQVGITNVSVEDCRYGELTGYMDGGTLEVHSDRSEGAVVKVSTRKMQQHFLADRSKRLKAKV